MLKRIKRKEIEGFKDFVANLESTPIEKRMEIIQVGILEDPNYMEWVMKNMATIDDVLKLDSEELALIFRRVPNGVSVLAKAFYKSPYHDQLIDGLMPKELLADYRDNIEYIKEMKKNQQDASRYLILKTMRELQKKDMIIGVQWTIPPVEIVRNLGKMISQNGVIEIKYEDGKLAAKGELLRNQRTGKWTHYFKNGNMMAQGSYSKGHKHGKWTFFYSDEKLRSEGEYIYDSKHGEWLEVDKKGIKTVCEFEEGLKISK